MADPQAVVFAPEVLAIDGIPGLVAVLSPTGEVDAVNNRVVEYCGQPLEAMRQWGTNGTVHADDVPRIAPLFMDAISAGVPYDFDARIRRHDGVYRWFRVRGQPWRDGSGSIARWYVVLADIDDRKRAEALLAGEKRLLEMVANGESMPVILEGICRFVESTAGRCYCSVVLVDPSGERLEHGAAPSLPGSFIDSIIGRPINIDSGPCAMAAYLNEQVIACDLTTETRWAAYEWCPMALSHGVQACWSTPISSTTGKVLGAFAIYYDEPRTPTESQQSLIEQLTNIASITIERTLEAEALKRSEALLSKVQAISGTGGFYLWPATGEAYWTDEVYRIHELDPGTPITPEVRRRRIHPDDLQALLEALECVVREARDFEYDVRLLMPDDRVKHLHLLMQATRDAEGDLLYVGAVQDVTSRRLSDLALSKVRSELAHVARVTTLGALTASIAHEVNQPLSGIITNASTCLRMLNADPPNVDGARETAKRTIRDGNRASDVIARLRALFSKKAVALEPLDLNDATREVLALCASDLQRNRITLHAELAEELPTVRGDRVELQQVILNLLRNASEAMHTVEDRPRNVVVATRLDDGSRVRLSVQDAGVGFASEVADKPFDAFFTTKPDGMGMGLFVCRSIIERHRGRIWATPNRGTGATVAFSLPTCAVI